MQKTYLLCASPLEMESQVGPRHIAGLCASMTYCRIFATLKEAPTPVLRWPSLFFIAVNCSVFLTLKANNWQHMLKMMRNYLARWVVVWPLLSQTPGCLNRSVHRLNASAFFSRFRIRSVVRL